MYRYFITDILCGEMLLIKEKQTVCFKSLKRFFFFFSQDFALIILMINRDQLIMQTIKGFIEWSEYSYFEA